MANYKQHIFFFFFLNCKLQLVELKLGMSSEWWFATEFLLDEERLRLSCLGERPSELALCVKDFWPVVCCLPVGYIHYPSHSCLFDLFNDFANLVYGGGRPRQLPLPMNGRKHQCRWFPYSRNWSRIFGTWHSSQLQKGRWWTSFLYSTAGMCMNQQPNRLCPLS